MAIAALPDGKLMTTADGLPLKEGLARALRRRKVTALLLVTPLLLFILVSFVMPIASLLMRSVDNPQVHEILPGTVAALAAWDGQGLPPEPVFAAFVADMRQAVADEQIGKVAQRLNYEDGGIRSLFNKTGRRIDQLQPPFAASLPAVDKRWADPSVWRLIQREGSPWTISYYLAALDLTWSDDGHIVRQSEDRRIYVMLYLRTLWVAGAITLLTLLLGYPLAYLLANMPPRWANVLMILVLLPFWTSLLVRTTSWIALLQQQGIINDVLVRLGILADDQRIAMVNNMTGTLIAMTHILLPFMILPLYSVMKNVPPSHMRAAMSLGATPVVAFMKVYLPQTLAGIGAGGLLVFILAIGYYITPALVGGQSGTLISNFIAYHMQQSLNWGLAGALGTILLIAVLLLYWLYNRIVGIDNMRLG